MLNKKWLLLCVSICCMLSFSVTALAAADKVSVTLLPDRSNDPVSSPEIRVTEKDALVWRISNTSTKNLGFSIRSMPPNWNYDPLQLSYGTVQPGETLVNWKPGKGIVLDYSKDPQLGFEKTEESISNTFYITLFGPGGGTAELSNNLEDIPVAP